MVEKFKKQSNETAALIETTLQDDLGKLHASFMKSLTESEYHHTRHGELKTSQVNRELRDASRSNQHSVVYSPIQRPSPYDRKPRTTKSRIAQMMSSIHKS